MLRDILKQKGKLPTEVVQEALIFYYDFGADLSVVEDVIYERTKRSD